MRHTKRRTEEGTQGFSLSLDPKSIKEIDLIAKAKNRSRSELVDLAIKEFLLRDKQKGDQISVTL